MKSKYRGYEIEFINGEYCFCDTGLSTVGIIQYKPCGHCDLMNTDEGHDGCIGTLIGVKNACCGHGEERMAYVQFLDGVELRGDEALSAIKRNRAASGGESDPKRECTKPMLYPLTTPPPRHPRTTARAKERKS